MKKVPPEMREIIGENIRTLRLKMFPGRGGGKKCAETFGVSQQQWSPWETGMRTPDSVRMEQMASFFNVPVEYFYERHVSHPVPPENPRALMPVPGFDPFSPPSPARSFSHCCRPAPGQPSGGDAFRNISKIAESISESECEVTITIRLKDPKFIDYTLKGCVEHLISQK